MDTLADSEQAQHQELTHGTAGEKASFGPLFGDAPRGKVARYVESREVVAEAPARLEERHDQSIRLQALAKAKALAQLGKAGWEMVSATIERDGSNTFYFKRLRVNR